MIEFALQVVVAILMQSKGIYRNSSDHYVKFSRYLLKCDFKDFSFFLFFFSKMPLSYISLKKGTQIQAIFHFNSPSKFFAGCQFLNSIFRHQNLTQSAASKSRRNIAK